MTQPSIAASEIATALREMQDFTQATYDRLAPRAIDSHPRVRELVEEFAAQARRYHVAASALKLAGFHAMPRPVMYEDCEAADCVAARRILAAWLPRKDEHAK